MKYIVEVNAKYLVSLEANSCLEAEHKMLDYNGVWGALAFDQKMTKTDTFLGAVQGCEMVSVKEFEQLIDQLMGAKLEAVKAAEDEKDARAELERLKEQAAELEAAISLARQKVGSLSGMAMYARTEYSRIENIVGKQRN